MKVVCIGSGYVGTVTAAAFAVLGHDTTIIDIDKTRVERINAGKSPIYEPGLEKWIAERAGRNLIASGSYEAVQSSDVVFICVGTPSSEDGTADLTYVRSAAEQIGRHLHPDCFTTVVIKSTVPIGTGDVVQAILERESGLLADKHYAVVSNPEFLREGFAVKDVLRPERIIVGGSNPQALNRMKELYRKIQAPLLVTDTRSAELIKYASNGFLAVKLSYINELARLCEVVGANVLEVAKGMGMDSRIGKQYLEASMGWGGSCLPKDTSEMIATGKRYGRKLSVLEAAVQANREMILHCVGKLERRWSGFENKSIGILGLTFKPGTDDVRHSQAIAMIRKLNQLGVAVSAHDPKGMAKFEALMGGLPIRYCQQPEEAAKNADALLLLTHWEEYRSLDWKSVLKSMRTPYVLDTRNFLSGERLREVGLEYEGIGIPRG